MPLSIKMPALSPTMEEGTLAKWLVKVGDSVSAGDIMAEIETDKVTMEFEAVDDGTIVDLAVPEGSEGVKVGTVIATLAEDGEDPGQAKAAAREAVQSDPASAAAPAPTPAPEIGQVNAAPTAPLAMSAPAAPPETDERIIASPLAQRIARQKGIDLSALKGSGPHGRVIKADVEQAQVGAAPAARPPAHSAVPDFDIPYETEKLSNVRKVIARRLTEAKQTIPHIYLTLDIQLDALLDLRGELNRALEGDSLKLSVNDLLIKALAKALARVPACNVAFAGQELRKYGRVDISVAVAAPGGLITPIVKDAAHKSISKIAGEMKALIEEARAGKLQPHQYQGGTASLSNLGMYGMKQFDAVINPPQAMIMAVGAGEKRPCVVGDALSVATVMTATGGFDHRAIDGANGAELMQAFKELVEHPLGLLA